MLSVIESCDQTCVSLQQVKAHLRLDHSDDDDYLVHLIKVATIWVEDLIESPLLTKKFLWQTTGENSRRALALPKQNITEIKRAVRLDSLGRAYPIRYKLQEKYGRLMLVAEIPAHSFEIEFVAGFGDRPETVPADIRQTIINHVAYHYDCRTGIDRDCYSSLLRAIQPYRKMGLS